MAAHTQGGSVLHQNREVLCKGIEIFFLEYYEVSLHKSGKTNLPLTEEIGIVFFTSSWLNKHYKIFSEQQKISEIYVKFNLRSST